MSKSGYLSLISTVKLTRSFSHPYVATKNQITRRDVVQNKVDVIHLLVSAIVLGAEDVTAKVRRLLQILKLQIVVPVLSPDCQPATAADRLQHGSTIGCPWHP